MHRSFQIIVLTAFASGLALGCDRAEPSPAQAPKPVAVEVTSDPAQIEAARRAFAQRREQLLAALLANPGEVRGFDEEALSLLRQNRDRATGIYARVRDSESAPAATRLRAAAVLRLLDVPTPAEQLADLASSDPEARFELMLRMSEFVDDSEPMPEALRRIVVASVDDPDKRTRRLAAHIAASHGFSEAADRIVSAFATGDPQLQSLAMDAAKLRPDRQVIALLVSRISQQKDVDSTPTLGALAEAVRNTPDAEARREGLDAMIAFLRAHPDVPWIDNYTMSALDSLAAMPREQAIETLSTLVRNANWKELRRQAIAALEKLDSDQSRKLVAELGIQPRPATAANASRAQLTPAQAADILVRHRVLSRSEADAALASMTNSASRDEDDDRSADSVRSLLFVAGRYHVFDVETGMVPNRHDLLIAELAAHSAGRFKPEVILETYRPDKPDADTGQYEVQFVHGQRLYRFRPTDLGDWFDLPAVVAAVDRALVDAGVAERFVALHSEGQVAELVFADPAALKAAAPELALTLGTDLDEARKGGKAFEEKVLQDIERRQR